MLWIFVRFFLTYSSQCHASELCWWVGQRGHTESKIARLPQKLSFCEVIRDDATADASSLTSG